MIQIGEQLNQLRGWLRQWRYPKPFRIGPPLWPADVMATLERIAAEVAAQSPAPTASAQADEQTISEEQKRMLADIGTGLWRLRQRMVAPGTDRPLEEMRRAFRHLEFTWDALVQAGVEIQSHTGMPFDSGLALDAIAFQAEPGMEREMVIETVKPSVYYKGKQIQIGQVVVGTPRKSESA